MQIITRLNYLRIAPRKVRQVAKLIEGLAVTQAEQQLRFLTKRSAYPLSQLLRSALSNAEHNFQLIKDNLLVKKLLVNEGRKLKRFRPQAMGRAAPIQKKTSRLTIILEEKTSGLKAIKTKSASPSLGTDALQPSAVAKPEGETAAAAVSPRGQAKKPVPDLTKKSKIRREGVFGGIKGVGRRLFRRKSV